MKITRLSLKNFRNISRMELCPGDGVNIIYGDNAQGKTNLIESIWLLSGARSFRGCKDAELVQLGQEGASVEAAFYGGGREQSIRMEYGARKLVLLNEIGLSSAPKLSGALYVVVFSPTHLSLVKDGPSQRREFIDTTICQLKPQYNKVLSDYSRVLAQRAALLKDLPYNAYLNDTLDIWDQHLVRLTATILKTRHTYLRRLSAFAEEIYAGISQSRETLALSYQTRAAEDLDGEDLTQQVAQAIRRARQEDIRAGATTVGAHRDDIAIEISGLSARSFGSQGQQRSVVLALKLAECGIIQQLTGEVPVVLLDDVMSELDAARRDYLLNSLEGRQIFITCCDRSLFSGIQNGRSFHIKGGEILREDAIAEAARPPEEIPILPEESERHLI